jgi:hypothetical protein
MQTQTTDGVMNQIGPQILNLNRRVSRSEVAKRVAHIDAYHIKQLSYKYFWDAEPSVTAWGPVESVSCFGTYKYYKNHTLATITNLHHGLYY